MNATRVDEIEPALPGFGGVPPMVSVLAMITEPDGTDRSSRIALPANSEDAAIVHALREVSVAAANLRGIPPDVADWPTMPSVDHDRAASILSDWIARRIAFRRTPTTEECRDLIGVLLRQTAP